MSPTCKSLLVAVIAAAVFGGIRTAAAGEPFSFAIIADPHIDGNADHPIELLSAVNHVIATKDDYNTQFVFVVGDLGWAQSNFNLAKGLLDCLNAADIPYIPLIGDNESQHASTESQYTATFAPQYYYLSGILPNWQKTPMPVSGKYLQNFSFDYEDCHFICADFNSRTLGVEGGDLHNATGGTWPWVLNDIASCAKLKGENINIMTHIPMFSTGIPSFDAGLFDSASYATIKDGLYPYRGNIDSNYAGHIHMNLNWNVSQSGNLIYTSRSTEETWYSSDSDITVRYVTATSGASNITYHQNIVTVPRIVPNPSTFVLHTGANDPLTEGWTKSGAGMVAGVHEGGKDAWKIETDSSACTYTDTFTAAQTAEMQFDGLYAEVDVDVVVGNGANQHNMEVLFPGIGKTLMWSISVYENVAGDACWRTSTTGENTVAGSGDGYHHWVLHVDPESLMAQLSMDDMVLATDLPYISAGDAAPAFKIVNDGYGSEANFHLFSAGTALYVPEPCTLTLLGFTILGFCAWMTCPAAFTRLTKPKATPRTSNSV